MRHEIISLKDLKGLYLLRRRFKKWRQNEWKNHVVYVYGPFDRVWAEEHPLRFSWIKEYMFIYLQTDYEMHWILRIFYRIFWISIFNTCSYGELFTGVSPIAPIRFQEHYIASSTISGGLPRAWQKMSFIKLCTALVQEQVYAWVIASSFVCSWKPPRYGGRHALETELVYRQLMHNIHCTTTRGQQIIFHWGRIGGTG